MKDKLIRAIDKDKSIRIFLVRNTEMLREAQKRHNTSPTVTAALGRTMAATSMMGAMLKEPNHKITVHFRGTGPLKNIMAVSDGTGDVKAFVSENQIEPKLRADGKLNVGELLVSGDITVIKDLGLKDPYIGKTQLVSGEIAEDLAQYFMNSEQQPSAVNLGVFIDGENEVSVSGGMIIQVLPDASIELIETLEACIFTMPPISEVLREDSLEEILDKYFDMFKFKKLAETDVNWKCDCSKERMESALISIGKEEIEKIIKEDEKAELNCHFCNTNYLFSKEELTKILKDLK